MCWKTFEARIGDIRAIREGAGRPDRVYAPGSPGCGPWAEGCAQANHSATIARCLRGGSGAPAARQSPQPRDSHLQTDHPDETFPNPAARDGHDDVVRRGGTREEDRAPQHGGAPVSTCIGCHAIPGYQASFPQVYRVPKIGGQSQQYIEAALKSYRQATASNPTMVGVAKGLTDEEIASVAAYSRPAWPLTREAKR